MKKLKWVLQLGFAIFILCVTAILLVNYFGKDRESKIEKQSNTSDEQWEKGYDLPIDDKEYKEASMECVSVLNLIGDIYVNADKGTNYNVVLEEEIIWQMQGIIGENGYVVGVPMPYSNMENYEKVENFLNECVNEKSGQVVLYNVMNNGGISRRKFIFDGKNMYVLITKGMWNENAEPYIEYMSYTRIEEWSYTEKGWFCYELCVPEYPEVTEMVDGGRLIRVKPMDSYYCELSEKYVLKIGYQGNNLLCSNWNVEKLNTLDYNGIYEYLYQMKYDKAFMNEKYSDGIPKEEFESLIMEYIPVTEEQIQKYAVYDEEKEKYLWERNLTPTFFATSIPEVTNVTENEDGTITLTVDAVCEMVLHNAAVITHELTIRVNEDGNFQYISNTILNDGEKYIPEYSYRIQ